MSFLVQNKKKLSLGMQDESIEDDSRIRWDESLVSRPLGPGPRNLVQRRMGDDRNRRDLLLYVNHWFSCLDSVVGQSIKPCF